MAQHVSLQLSSGLPPQNHALTQGERLLLQKQVKPKRPFLSSFCGTWKVQAVSSGDVGSKNIGRRGGFFTSISSCHLWC